MTDDGTQFEPIPFLEDAVRIDSCDSVDEITEFLLNTLVEHGADARTDSAGNVIATRGHGGRHVVLNTHMDTVSPGLDQVPFERRENAIHGRGACDAKGSLAALLSAFFAIDSSVLGADGTVTLAVTPDEETETKGSTVLDLDADDYIVGEPTGLDVCNAAKGRLQGTVKIHGRSAHAAQPNEGKNVIDAVSSVSAGLQSFDNREDAPGPHPELGSPTLTPTMINGGVETNRVPDYCEIVIDRRTVFPELSESFESDLEMYLAERMPEGFRVEFNLDSIGAPFLKAFETPVQSQLVQTLMAASGGTVRPFTAGTDASRFADDAPTVVFGPGVLADEDGAVAHSNREYVPVGEVRTAAAAVTETVTELLRNPWQTERDNQTE